MNIKIFMKVKKVVIPHNVQARNEKHESHHRERERESSVSQLIAWAFFIIIQLKI